jgi:hypothetical protein
MCHEDPGKVHVVQGDQYNDGCKQHKEVATSNWLHQDNHGDNETQYLAMQVKATNLIFP